MEVYGRIYVIENRINHKSYVGQTTHSIEDRFKEHCNAGKNGKILTKAIRKYGKGNFIVKELDVGFSKEETDIAEKYWVWFLDTLAPNGYNIKEGGGSRGGWSEEGKRIISESLTDEGRESLRKRMRESNPMVDPCVRDRATNKWLEWKRSDAGRRAQQKTVESTSGIYHFITPEGKEISFKNLSDFCRKSGLERSSMASVANGRRKQHRGWRHNKRYPLHESLLHKSRSPSKKRFKVVNPEGETVEIYGLSEFCRKNGFSREGFSAAINGRAKHYRGWRKYSKGEVGVVYRNFRGKGIQYKRVSDD